MKKFCENPRHPRHQCSIINIKYFLKISILFYVIGDIDFNKCENY